jgi:hypothetical protein
MGEWYNGNTLPQRKMEVSMKRCIAVLMAVAVILTLTGPVLAASLGISPSSVELEVPADGSATASFKVHYFNGDVKVSLVDIPLTVEPETVHVDALDEPADIEVTIYGDPSLGSEVYNGYIKFLGMSGEMISVAVQVKATVTNIVEGQAVSEEPDTAGSTAGDQPSQAGNMGGLSRTTIVIIASAVIVLGLVILAVSFARRR